MTYPTDDYAANELKYTFYGQPTEDTAVSFYFTIHGLPGTPIGQAILTKLQDYLEDFATDISDDVTMDMFYTTKTWSGTKEEAVVSYP